MIVDDGGGRCVVQALTAEMNMMSSKGEEDKAEIVKLRKDINDWKHKYYDCQRKLSAQ